MGKNVKHKKPTLKLATIYGIYNLSKKKLIKVSLSKQEIEMEFELGDYGDDDSMVNMKISLVD